MNSNSQVVYIFIVFYLYRQANMEGVLNQKVYQMVIQLKDHQAVVVVQKHEPLEINSRKEKTGFDFISPEKREEKESTENQSGKTRDSSPRDFKNDRVEEKEEKKFNGIEQNHELRVKKVSPTKTQQIKMLKNTLVDSLTRIAREKQSKQTPQPRCNRLENLEWIETCSITESESYDFDDNQSEVMELTTEERQFFNNFIHQSPFPIDPNEEEITALQLIPIVSPREVKCDHLPSNKNKVLRNFFRPKLNGSFKGQKSCMTSNSSTESMMTSKSPDRKERFFEDPLLL